MLLVYLAVAWLVGIFLGRVLWSPGIISCATPPTWVWEVVSAALIVGAIFLRRRRKVRLALVLLLFAILGGWRYQSHPPEPCFTTSDLAYHNGSQDHPLWVTIEGTISNYPDERDRRTNYTLQAHSLEIDVERFDVSGLVLLQAPRFPQFEYGDSIRLSGFLQAPPCNDDFCWREILALDSIHSLIKYLKNIEVLAHNQGIRFRTTPHAFRSHASSTINHMLPEPQAALLRSPRTSSLYWEYGTTLKPEENANAGALENPS